MRLAAQSYEFNLENGLAIVGSPETVIRKIEDGKQRIGYEHLLHQPRNRPDAKQLVQNFH